MVELPIIEHETITATVRTDGLEYVYTDRVPLSKGKEAIYEVADALGVIGRNLTTARTEWVYLTDEERHDVALRIAYKLFS